MNGLSWLCEKVGAAGNSSQCFSCPVLYHLRFIFVHIMEPLHMLARRACCRNRFLGVALPFVRARRSLRFLTADRRTDRFLFAVSSVFLSRNSCTPKSSSTFDLIIHSGCVEDSLTSRTYKCSVALSLSLRSHAL